MDVLCLQQNPIYLDCDVLSVGGKAVQKGFMKKREYHLRQILRLSIS